MKEKITTTPNTHSFCPHGTSLDMGTMNRATTKYKNYKILES
jgi:hypothetical protein